MLHKTATNTSYRGGENQSVFPIPFPFLENSHITAVVRTDAGATRVLEPGVDFIINRISEDNGELILMEEPLPAGSLLSISRRIPLTQEIYFHNQGPNSPRAIEEATDKLTMIAQQLQAGIDDRVPIPEGTTAEEAMELIGEIRSGLEGVRSEFASVAASVDAKADRRHSHVLEDVAGLENSLVLKADAGSVATALSRKADKGDLLGKSDLGHTHAATDIANLTEALAGKVDNDDPRLGQFDGGVPPHAALHAADGPDPVTPKAIGAMSPPPADGKPYLAAAGGWIEYIEPSDGDGGAGTFDHSQLQNRMAADQHPQSAIIGLPDDLERLRGGIAFLETTAGSQAALLAEKADRRELPSEASGDRAGLMSPLDKRRLDFLYGSGEPLPVGGTAGSILSRDELNAPAWVSPEQLTATLPAMSRSQAGIARLAEDGGLTVDGDGALGLTVPPVTQDYVDGRVETLAGGLAAAGARLDGVDGQLAELRGRLNQLGALAGAADAPFDGKYHVRQNGYWVEMPVQLGNAAAKIVGEIRLLPFRSGELPSGWYFCNGDRYSLGTVPGAALNALPYSYKVDWGIVVSGDTINLPSLFCTEGGFFLRAVDNGTRLPGSGQNDTIRNITGHFGVAEMVGMTLNGSAMGSSSFWGALKPSAFGKSYAWNAYALGTNTVGDLDFDASCSVPTAHENRPVNIGMTPAIYLGA